MTAQRLLVATGRHSDTTALDLATAGVDTEERGFVVIDEHQATSNPWVYAAGDVAGTPQYVYVAAESGRVAAANALADDAVLETVDSTGLPAVVFTRPQLASAGLTEEEALRQGHECTRRTLALEDVPRALENRDTGGVLKLVADTANGKVLSTRSPTERSEASA